MRSALIGAAALAAFGCSVHAQTLPERARKQGPIEVVAISEYLPTTLDLLTRTADAIVLGLVVSRDSKLTADQQSIDTDYTVQVLESFKGDRAIPQSVRVRRPGGTVYVDGRKVTVAANRFPQFDPSETYILFLRYDPSTRTYEVLFGPHGTLSVENDTLTPKPGLGPSEEEIKSMQMTEFRKLIQNTLSSAPRK